MQTVKGKRYYEGRKFNTIIEMLEQTCEMYPETDAYIFRRNPEGEEILKKYSEYLDDIKAFGTALMGLGLSGTHVAVLGENRYEWAVAGTAVVNGVGISVPIDKLLPSAEVENLLGRGEASAYIFSPKFIRDALDIAARNDKIKYFICMDMSDTGGITPEDPRFIDMKDLILSGRKAVEDGDRSFLDAKIDPEAMSLLLFTSGTTSMSKGVMLSQKNVCSNIASVSGVIRIDAGTRTLSVLPLHHTFENSVGMYMMQYYGATICFTDGLRYISKNLSEWKINNILAVPLLFENIYNKVNEALESSGKKNLVSAMVKVSRASLRVGLDIRRKLFKQILAGFGGHLELAVSGAAAIDPKIAQAFTDWGVKFYQGYGLTETSPVLSACNEFVNIIGSIGNPVSEVELAIDTEDPQPGATGEILARGPNVMIGYYKDPEATAEVMTEDGWFRTGDVGYLDKYGCIHITGKIKSMIVLTNGKKCFPEEIEALLSDIPGLKETLVWGESNNRDAVDIVAALHIDRDKAAKEAGSDKDEDIARWLSDGIREVNSRLPNFKNIKYFVITEQDLIKTTTLKIKRNVNVDLIRAKLVKVGQDMRGMHMRNIDYIA